ncbi:hypothetical protein V5799_012006 [Amblyomma americanum]|uniref:Single domain-containing protein n=1 Tax=Amblyomma americanum TaxID=6943 RepID=A0AAQ4EF90_AMBAM
MRTPSRTRVLFALVASVLQWMYMCEASTFSVPTVITNGQCEYQGSMIPVGQSVDLVNPCERASCDGQSNQVQVERCAGAEAGAGCRLLSGTGPYPRCCPKIACA